MAGDMKKAYRHRAIIVHQKTGVCGGGGMGSVLPMCAHSVAGVHNLWEYLSGCGNNAGVQAHH